ncbi:MAG: AAA family ATPase [Campylobacterota bacterium]|nr:AAA family ATPase [Campylobacterota bacterium]
MNSSTNYTTIASQIEAKIKEEVFEQDLAVESLIKALVESTLIQTKNKLKAFFTFIGPANCGKQYILETLAKNDPNIDSVKTFHMDQYSGNYALNEDHLSTYTFQNELFEFLQENKNSILVFKDIEKADLQVQLTLYTFLTQFEQYQLDLSNTIVIIETTRLSSFIRRKDFQKILKQEPLQAHAFLMDKMSNESITVNSTKESLFHKKLLSLMNEHSVIAFKNLSLNTLIKIATRSLHTMSKSFSKQSNISIEYVDIDEIIWFLTLSLSPYINAKYIKQKLPKQLFNNIYEAMKLKKDINYIRCSVSKKSKNFLKEILKDKKALISSLKKEHKHISLKWKITQDEECVKCTIDDAYFTKDEMSVSSQENLLVSDIGFDDIAGQKKVKDELKEIISLLKEPKRLQSFHMTPPKGMILYGPVGMGKKILCKAFAQEANMPYITISGSELFDPSKINEAYEKAYSNAPCVVIFEDIDTEGILNGVISTMSTEPITLQLDKLQQSFESPIFTLITINDITNIPETLIQANRIDIKIEVPKLDMEARRFFIEEVLKKPHDKNIDIDRIVRYISGMGGDELKRIGQEASLYAARKGIKKLTEEILLEQINIIKYGTKLENKQIRDIETSMKKTAYHEAGHAVLSFNLLPKIKIEQVTVAPRSESLGFVSYHNEDYIDATSKDDIFNDICVLLAGRVAKMEKFGDEGMETGAISDLETATMQAYGAIALFGMDEELGYINISTLTAGLNKQLFSDKVEKRLLEWINKAKIKTEQEVKKHWKAIEAVAQELIKKEMIDGVELKTIIEKNQ